MQTHEIVKALYRYYQPRGYLCLDELKPGTGTAGGYMGGIDFWCMHQWPSERYARIAIEIKVSRSDYLREARQKQKQGSALRHSNLLYFIAPHGIISPWELRQDAGLLEATEDGGIREIKPAPWRDSPPPSLAFLAAVMRRMDRLRSAAASQAFVAAGGRRDGAA